MKRVATILLLIIFLFNVGGYYLVFLVLRFQANAVLVQRLDANQYSQEELIELRIPVTLPYPIQQQGFERVDGKFEHDGQFYKMVKHKLENDILVIVCIKDKAEKKLVKTMNEYAKMITDLPSSSKKSQNLLSKLLKDFESTETAKLHQQKGWSMGISKTHQSFVTLNQSYAIISPPPKA